MSAEQLDWLRTQIKTCHPRALAKEVGCCEDTLRRILDEHDILPAQGAKHVRRKNPIELWERPCMSCKTTKPRPKNQYICDHCKRKASSETTGIADEYLMF